MNYSTIFIKLSCKKIHKQNMKRMLKLEFHCLDLFCSKYYNFFNGVHFNGDSHQSLQYCVVMDADTINYTYVKRGGDK